MSWRAAALALLCAAAFTAGCEEASSGKSEPMLAAEWSGSDTGKIATPVTAEWCDSLHLLEIRALRGDTGIAIAIYPRNRLQAGRYPIKPPLKADSVPPAAALGLRWFASTSVRGFQGDSGSVVMEELLPGIYSGVLEAKAHSVTDGGRVTVRGLFSHVTIRPGSRGCVPRKAPADTGAGVH